MQNKTNQTVTSWILLAGISVLSLFFLSSCLGPKTSLALGIEETKQGTLKGYLEFKEIPNSLVLIPPPPDEESTALALDQEISKKNLELNDSVRFEQAKQDAILYFPEALMAFSEILDVPISEKTTPNLYMLLRRILPDAAFSTYTAKKHYMRPRPFMVNKLPTCTPDDEAHLKDGSYPSGHAAIGWAWALAFCEIFPEKTNHIIQRGREFGESRIVCNVHWQSDITEGRFMGAATVARLHANPTFKADLKAAKKEVASLKASK